MEPANGEEESGSENSESNRHATSPMEVDNEDEDKEQELSMHTSSK
jgi:hypothetical protein